MEFIKIFKNYKELNGKVVTLKGFVKSNRVGSKVSFLSLVDGTTFKHIQIVYNSNINNYEMISTFKNYTCVEVVGELVSLENNSKQDFEIKANSIKLLKLSDNDYPLQKKEHSLEFLRDIAHLRPRTNTFNAIMRVRSVLSFLIHEFFNKHDFCWVSSPLITSNDGEGAGETFIVKTNDKEEFFGSQATLSVTGQLQAEAYAQAFKNVYTFGPTFRAEKSHTSRHAAEFWMVEPEVAFCDINGLFDLIENMLVYVTKGYIEKCKDEIEFLSENYDKNLKTNLNNIIKGNFNKVSYTEVIDILNQAVKEGHKFNDNNIQWGMDLASEHEKFICENHFNGPTFVYNYPKDIKAFYMFQNEDNKTVAATDLLVPGIGELVGGSQRESSYEKLLNRCNELKMDIDPLKWYIELRKYGYYMSSGFGLGFERLIMYLTGINNIRDTIPFPRNHGQIKF